MMTALFRVMKYGLQNFTRNFWLSGATLAIMILTLLVAEGLIIFNVASRVAITSVQDKIDVSLYIKQTVAEGQILTMKAELERLPEVRAVEYISREKALDLFKARRGGDPTVAQALEELGENPLLASLNVKAEDPRDYPKIVAYADEYMRDSIEKLSYVETKLLIDRLNRVTETVQTFGIALNIFLGLIAIIITFNTISLAIYSNREEIGIMRLVGASNRFIRGPYFVTGVLYGIIGAVLSILIALPFIHAATSVSSAILPEFNLQEYFYGNIWQLLFYQLLAGIFLGVVSSMIAISRYLKV